VTRFPSVATVRHRLATAVVYLASGVAAVAASFLVAGLSQAFLVLAVSSTLLFFMPDRVLAWGILTLRAWGMDVLLITSTVVAVGLFAAVARASVWIASWTDRMRAEAVFAVGAIQAVCAFLLTIRPLVAFASGFAGALTVAIAGRTVTNPQEVPGRRKVLRSIAVATAAVGWGWLTVPRPPPLPDEDVDDETVLAMLDAADERSVDLPGAEPLVSQNFYQVDINKWNPVLGREEWTLTIRSEIEGTAGAGGEPFVIDYEALTSREAEHRFVTLRCVSDSLNGGEIDTALWTGVPIEGLLADAGAPEECCVLLEADDGYTHAFPRSVLEKGFLAWRMNGKLLPRDHGHPVRALIPGHWGEVNVKWLTGIEIRDEPATGYWERRGWDGDGEVVAIAKLHSKEIENGQVRIGGHAYAGTRGVDRVEVSTDGGETWTDARLTEPLPAAVPVDADPADIGGRAADAWRQWHYEYEASEEHEVVVRAVERDGTVQPGDRDNPYPSGASGWVREEIDPT
jgi:DMSO/TMAO reductase YedYZ molybdopterin-dependent catalytic subunit